MKNVLYIDPITMSLKVFKEESETIFNATTNTTTILIEIYGTFCWDDSNKLNRKITFMEKIAVRRKK